MAKKNFRYEHPEPIGRYEWGKRFIIGIILTQCLTGEWTQIGKVKGQIGMGGIDGQFFCIAIFLLNISLFFFEALKGFITLVLDFWWAEIIFEFECLMININPIHLLI